MPGTEGKTPKIACYVKKTGIVCYGKGLESLIMPKKIMILGCIDGLMHNDWNLVEHVAGFQENGIG